MKKAIHYWGLPPAMTLPEKLRFAAACGFEGVELVVLEAGAVRPDATSGELLAVRRAAERAGVAIHSLTTPLNWACSLTSGRAEIRERARETLRMQMRIAAALGAGAVLALPGFVALDFEVNALCAARPGERAYSPTQEIVDYEDAWDRALEGFSALSACAGELGVDLCIENIWNHFLLSPLEMRRLIDAVDSPRVKAYFDVGNAMEYGYPEQWIRILGRRIGRVHFKDYRRGAHDLSGFTPLLAGDVDFAAVMAALRGAGYDGWVTAELNADPAAPEQAARAAAAAMARILRGA